MPLGLGLIGTDFMEKAHALAYRFAPTVFDDLPEVGLAVLCDNPADRAEAMARQLDFDHPPYGPFCPTPGHQLGLGDLKTVEAAAFLRAIADDREAFPNFTDALGFERGIHAIDVSAHEGRRADL